MKKILVVILAFIMMAPLAAGVSMDLGDNSKATLGGLFQAQNIWNKTSSTLSSGVKRARIKLCYDYDKLFSFLVQTDIGLNAGGLQGEDVRLVDAYAVLKLNKFAHIYNGMFLAPSSRQTTVLPNGLMTGTYSATAFKALTWTGKVKNVFNSGSASGTSAGFLSDTLVRDTGIALFGSDSINKDMHFKYYIGAFNGCKFFSDGGQRLTGRVQVNLFDPEPGYYNLTTYLGDKKTVALGFSYDVQPGVRSGTTDSTLSSTTAAYLGDYKYMSLDFFTEYPVGPGTITAEGAYNTLDLEGNMKTAEGNGLFAQLGYYMEGYKLQPWISYEKWTADDSAGSCTVVRAGASYYINGNNLNIKAGVEQYQPETGSKIYSAICGIYAAF
ncbi:MAG: hypothetical protein GY730_02860 [bacterium]|nr:hypothetical protein [bacterium]